MSRGIWLLSLAHYPRRLHTSAMFKSQNKVLTLKAVVSGNHSTRLSKRLVRAIFYKLVYIYMCVCVCVYIYVCVCVCHLLFPTSLAT